MPDPLSLPAEPTPKSRRGLLVLGLILACAAVWLYGRHAASTIVSRQALVEGRTFLLRLRAWSEPYPWSKARR